MMPADGVWGMKENSVQERTELEEGNDAGGLGAKGNWCICTMI